MVRARRKHTHRTCCARRGAWLQQCVGDRAGAARRARRCRHGTVGPSSTGCARRAAPARSPTHCCSQAPRRAQPVLLGPTVPCRHRRVQPVQQARSSTRSTPRAAAPALAVPPASSRQRRRPAAVHAPSDAISRRQRTAAVCFVRQARSPIRSHSQAPRHAQHVRWVRFLRARTMFVRIAPVVDTLHSRQQHCACRAQRITIHHKAQHRVRWGQSEGLPTATVAHLAKLIR